MPLSAELEKLLTFVPEAEREARRKELTELSDNGLRQADYSRKMNEVAEQRKQAQAAHQKNLEWYNTASKQYEATQGELKAAQERLAALESVKDAGGNTFEDESGLEKQLAEARKVAEEAQKRIGALTQTVDTFDKMIKEGKVITSDKFDEEVNRRGDALGAALLDIIDLQDKHRKEFGSDLDRRALLEEAQQHQNGNLANAYKVITEKAREEKLRKDIEADVEKRWIEKQKASNTPYAPSGEPVLGPLQQRLQKKDTGIPDDVAADGSGRMASLIAAELRQEGKA